MPNSPRMDWPYPSENTDPWWRAFVAFVNSMDASAFAAREDRSLLLLGGGFIAFDAVGNVLSWSAPIQLFSPLTGFLLQVPLDQSPITVTEGQVVYVDLVRNPTASQNVTISTANQVPSSDTALILALRKGNKLYWRNGALLFDGENLQLFEQRVGAGGGGNVSYLHLAPKTVVSGADGVIAVTQFAFNASEWAFGEFRFRVVLSLSSGSLIGQAQLYNLTDAEVVTNGTLTTSSTTAVKLEGTLTPGSAAGNLKDSEKIYELRLSNNGSLPSQLVYLGSSSMRMSP